MVRVAPVGLDAALEAAPGDDRLPQGELRAECPTDDGCVGDDASAPMFEGDTTFAW